MVEKSHVITDKKRGLVVSRGRWNEEGKILGEGKMKVESEVGRL